MITVFKYVKDCYKKEKLLSTDTPERTRNNKLRERQIMFLILNWQKNETFERLPPGAVKGLKVFKYKHASNQPGIKDFHRTAEWLLNNFLRSYSTHFDSVL